MSTQCQGPTRTFVPVEERHHGVEINMDRIWPVPPAPRVGEEPVVPRSDEPSHQPRGWPSRQRGRGSTPPAPGRHVELILPCRLNCRSFGECRSIWLSTSSPANAAKKRRTHRSASGPTILGSGGRNDPNRILLSLSASTHRGSGQRTFIIRLPLS